MNGRNKIQNLKIGKMILNNSKEDYKISDELRESIDQVVAELSTVIGDGWTQQKEQTDWNGIYDFQISTKNIKNKWPTLSVDSKWQPPASLVEIERLSGKKVGSISRRVFVLFGKLFIELHQTAFLLKDLELFKSEISKLKSQKRDSEARRRGTKTIESKIKGAESKLEHLKEKIKGHSASSIMWKKKASYEFMKSLQDILHPLMERGGQGTRPEAEIRQAEVRIMSDILDSYGAIFSPAAIRSRIQMRKRPRKNLE